MEPTRREILISASGLVAALHAGLGALPLRASIASKPTIRRVGLRTAVDLERMESFYCGKLGLSRISRIPSALGMQAGATRFEFTKVGAGKPLNHFAFNVPENKIRSVLDWAAKRFEVIPAWGDLADPKMPPEIVHFRHWNAHSVFFFDPALNLVELIARHELPNSASGAFKPSEFECISEIGLPTRKPAELAARLNKELGVPAYPRGTSPNFAMGDANGLLLCLMEDQRWGDHTKTPIRWGSFPMEVDFKARKSEPFEIPGHPYQVRSV